MKKIGLLLIFLFLSPLCFTQTTLSAGDIAIVGYNFDDADDFAFVLLVDFSLGTTINFTDNGWLATGSFRSGEGTITYTAPSNLTSGTVIVHSANSTDFTSDASFSLRCFPNN